MSNGSRHLDAITWQRANRHGFLLGVTLAELVLIALFVLLLPLGSFLRIEIVLVDRRRRSKRASWAARS